MKHIKVLIINLPPIGLSIIPRRSFVDKPIIEDAPCKRIKQILMEYNAAKRGKGIIFS